MTNIPSSGFKKPSDDWFQREPTYGTRSYDISKFFWERKENLLVAVNTELEIVPMDYRPLTLYIRGRERVLKFDYARYRTRECFPSISSSIMPMVWENSETTIPKVLVYLTHHQTIHEMMQDHAHS